MKVWSSPSLNNLKFSPNLMDRLKISSYIYCKTLKLMKINIKSHQKLKIANLKPKKMLKKAKLVKIFRIVKEKKKKIIFKTYKMNNLEFKINSEMSNLC